MSDILQQLLNSSTEDGLNNLYTAIPCIIIAIRDNLNEMMVDVQPAINQRMKNGTVVPRPPILGVPVQFPVSKTAGFTFPLNVGDTGLAVFSMRNLDAWKAGNGYPTSPMNTAKFDKGDAIFIPGVQPTSIAVNNPNKRLWAHDTKDAVLVNNIGQPTEVEVRLKASGDLVINTNSKVEVNCNDAVLNASVSTEVNTPDCVFNVDTFRVNASSSAAITAPRIDLN